MFTWSHFFAGLIAAAIGALGVKYTFQVANYTGSQDWIERWLGPGSTYGVYKILAVLLTLGGLLYASGFGNNLMEFFFAPFKSVFAPLGK